MYKVALVTPVLPGKDASKAAAVLKADPSGYVESRTRLGVTLERAYEMPTPMGTFLIAYIESERPWAETSADEAQSDLPIDRAFAAAILDVHGIDITAPPPGPLPELIADWTDPTIPTRKRGLAFCAPVMPGAEDAGRAFAAEAYDNRLSELEVSRRALGISRESVTLNTSPAGQSIAVYIEGDDPVEGNRRFAASTAPYDVWFKDVVGRTLAAGVDFNIPLPPIVEVFDSQEFLVAR